MSLGWGFWDLIEIRKRKKRKTIYEVDSYGNKKILGSKYVEYKFYDAGVESLIEDPSILPEEQGVPIRLEMLK